MTTFLLVHGTFAKDAEWTQPQSQFCQVFRKALSEIGEVAKFVPIAWSGRNRITDRLVAAKEILSKVNSIKSDFPNEKLFVVGHSHGGSAISYYLNMYQEEAASILGAIFLSTPFIALRPKDNIESRTKLYFYVFCFSIYFFLFFVCQRYAEIADAKDQGFYLLSALNLIFGTSLIGLYRAFLFWKKLADRRRSEVDLIIKNIDSCHLPDGHYLFIRFSGDEAAAGLSFAQFLSYGFDKLVDLIYSKQSLLITRLEAHSLVGKGFAEALCLVALCVWFCFSPLIAGYRVNLTEAMALAKNVASEAREEEKQELKQKMAELKNDRARLTYLLGPYDTQRQGPPALPPDKSSFRMREEIGRLVDRMENIQRQLDQDIIDVDKSTIVKFYFISSLKVLSAFIFTVLGIFAAAILVIFASLRTFGSTQLAEMLYIEHSVEVLPQGNHQLIHLDWKDLRFGSGLRHSQVYSSSRALKSLTDWVVICVQQS